MNAFRDTKPGSVRAAIGMLTAWLKGPTEINLWHGVADRAQEREINLSGATLHGTWQVTSVSVPMSRVELVVNGEIRESVAVPAEPANGQWQVKVERSSWLASLVRGHFADQPEIITAHATPIMVMVEESPLLAAADAVTILDQIEGAMA